MAIGCRLCFCKLCLYLPDCLFRLLQLRCQFSDLAVELVFRNLKCLNFCLLLFELLLLSVELFKRLSQCQSDLLFFGLRLGALIQEHAQLILSPVSFLSQLSFDSFALLKLL